MPRPYRERKKEDPANVKARHDRYNAKKRTEGRVERRNDQPTGDAAIALYRETVRQRTPEIKKREAEVMARVKAAVQEADRRAVDLRNGGRPRKRSLPPMLLGRKVDVLLNAVPEWQGQR